MASLLDPRRRLIGRHRVGQTVRVPERLTDPATEVGQVGNTTLTLTLPAG